MKKWIKALRSGKYVQGAGRLTLVSGQAGVPDQFCCLGVLCDITKLGTFNFQGTWYTLTDEVDNPNEAGYIPTPILKLIGLELNDTLELASRNDAVYGERYTFEEIAEVLECILFFEE